MKILGVFSAAAIGLAAFAASVLAVRSVPDIKRYLRMRSM